MKTLIIDDEPFTLQLLAHLLANLGFEDVISCEQAVEALTLIGAGSSSIGLIFCDLNMPGMDGVEFLRHLTGINYAGGLVLVSGVGEDVLRSAQKLAQGHHLNVLGALNKPVSPERLRQVLENHSSLAASPGHAPRKSYDPEALRKAIADGELVNHYQPKVEVATGAVVGVETLVRWQHPQDGLVFPDQFISLAEEHGLIDDLTRAVLPMALSQARAWQDAGLSLHMAVNISMDNFTELDFPDWVVRMASEAGLPLSSLVLEVTESQLMKHPQVALDILTRLRIKGVGLSIDDFGTGHSSLAQLRDLPFSELKLDRGFVHGAGRDKHLNAFFDTNLRMARQLALKTVAEGVEDRPDWDYLQRSGCDLAQGYFIAKPMPGVNLVDWMVAWEARRGDLAGNAA